MPVAIDIPVEIDVPINLVVDIPIDTVIPVDEEIEVALDFPVTVPIEETTIPSLFDQIVAGPGWGGRAPRGRVRPLAQLDSLD